jgi:hypothetical protein
MFELRFISFQGTISFDDSLSGITYDDQRQG